MKNMRSAFGAFRRGLRESWQGIAGAAFVVAGVDTVAGHGAAMLATGAFLLFAAWSGA